MLLDEQIPEEEYNKLPGLRSTALKYFMKFGPRAYYQKYVLQVFEPEEEDKPAYLIGRLFHALVIEEKREWAVWDGGRRGTNKYKAFEEESHDAGLTVITDKQQRQLLLMEQSFNDNPMALHIKQNTARREQTIQFNAYGHACKVRLDMWLDDDTIVDLKTTRNPLSDKFFYQLDDLGYHYSAAFYELGVQSYLETDSNIPFCFVTVENVEPYRCAVHTMHEDVKEVARRDVRSALKCLAECYRDNEWPEPLAKDIHEHTPSMGWMIKNGIQEVGSGY